PVTLFTDTPVVNMRFVIASLLIAFAVVASLAVPLPAPAANPVSQKNSGDVSPNRDWPVASQTKVHFLESYKIEVTFECLSPLEDDLEFKLVYVSSAENTTMDQELDSLLVGPVPVGVNKFVFEAAAPHVNKIPKDDLVGVAVILLTCSYKDKEFVRIGYFVENAYLDEELLLSPPDVPVLEKIYRRISSEKPRVTRFPINWDDPSKEEHPPAQPADGEMVDDDAMDADNQLSEDALAGDNDDEEDEGEDEDEEDEEEEDEDDDEDDVDLEQTKDQDDEELISDEEEETGNAAAEEDDDDDDDEMMGTDDHVAQHMVAHAGMYSAATMEVE
ncbi:Histone chaperone asf1, partial [Coemansia sp. BCRC 34301]